MTMQNANHTVTFEPDADNTRLLRDSVDLPPVSPW